MGTGATSEPGAEGAGRTAHAAAVEHAATTLRQRELGKRLRSLRTERGMSVADAAEELRWPPGKIRELEEAANLPADADLRDLRLLFKLDPAMADQLTALAAAAKRQSRWTDYQGTGAPYIRLEQNASLITAYSMHYFPALVQTEEYARALIATMDPRVDERALEERVKARLRRQDILAAAPGVSYCVLLDETVLRRPTGGRAVIRKQLDKVLEMIRKDQVDLRIVPVERGAGVTQDSNFVLLQFGEPDLLPVVFREGLAAYQLLDGKRDVDRYLEETERLKESALGPDDSADLVKRIRDNYRDD